MQRIFLLFLGAVFFLAPGLTQAFEATDSAAYQITADTYLFMIQYEFGYLNAEAQLPVYATPGTITDSVMPHVSYELYDEDDTVVVGGQTVGIVLSGAEKQGNFYLTKPATRETFTLLVLHRRDGASVAPSELRVTSLGNVVDTGEQTSYLAVNDDQLAGYRASLSQ
jgi:hypothetical protein